MNVLDLFSGIGGFSLGLERAGMRTVAFCEIDQWCRRVIAKHWPGVPCYDDVRDLTAARLRADGVERIDVICGGFPCQDISTAGKGAGLDGERSGLWREFFRIIGDVRPRFAIVENVGAIRGRGLARVLGDLAAIGFDAEWHAIPAAAIGAPHLRDRVWIVAADADADGGRRQRERQPEHVGEQGTPGRQSDGLGARGRREWPASNTDSARLGALGRRILGEREAAGFTWARPSEPPLRRMDDGIPARLDRPRLKALGNAVVPQIPELIGRALLAGETP